MGRIQTPPDPEAVFGNDFPRLMSLMVPGNSLREEVLRLADSSQGYLHWTVFRYKRPFPEGIGREEGWALVRMYRQNVSKRLPFHSKAGTPMTVSLTDGLHAAVRRIGARRSLLRAGLPKQLHADMPESLETLGLKALIDEAYYSAVIEGAVSTRRDARRMIREENPPSDHSELMILNNYRAGRQMVEWVKEKMTPERLCEIQKILTEGTLEHPEDSGQFRSGPVYVTDNDRQEVVHSGPDAQELPERIARLCDYANHEDSEDPIPVLVRASLLHYQLAYDHPFGDGNGRTARWLFLWRLLRCPEYWWVAMLSISRMTNQGKQEYYDTFRFAEVDGFDTTYLVRQQLHALEREMERFARFLTRRRDLGAHLRDFFALRRVPNQRQLALLEHAFHARNSAYTQPEHAAFHQISQPTARKDLEDLVHKGMMKRRSGRPVLYTPSTMLKDAARGYRTSS